MATTTTNYGLRKPSPDPSPGDFVNVATDINDSMDIIDDLLKERQDAIDALDTRVDSVEAAGPAAVYGVLARKATSAYIFAAAGHIPFDASPYLINGFTADLVTHHGLVVPRNGLYYCRLSVLLDLLAGSTGMTTFYVSLQPSGSSKLSVSRVNPAAGQLPVFMDGYHRFNAGEIVNVALSTSNGPITKTTIPASNVSGTFQGSGSALFSDTSSAEFSMLFVAP